VSNEVLQAVEIAIVATIMALVVIYLARKERISFRYTVGWLALCGVSIFGGLFIPVIRPVAERLRLDSFTLIAAVAVIVLLGLSVQLSISISGLQRQLRDVNEDVAILKKEVEDTRGSQK
jgi:hypothetical protein